MATQGRRRALGQHFLRDVSISEAIAEAALQGADKHQCSRLLEIGPGQGAITHPILKKIPDSQVKEFFLVERDPKLAARWRDTHVRVETADFLDLPEEKWLNEQNLAVVSNLPYSAGTAILTRLARKYARIP